MKKFLGFLFFLFLLAGAAAVFYYGWVQHRIPVGKFGVFSSQTNGIEKDVIENGQFAWRWQCLIPDNSRLFIFEHVPTSVEGVISQDLPMADTYKKLLSEGDFSYSVKYKATVQVNLAHMSDLVAKKSVETQEDLTNFLKNQAELLKTEIISHFENKFRSSEEVTSTDFTLNLEEGKAIFDFETNYPRITVTEFSVSVDKVPNIPLYNVAKSAYNDYLAKMEEQLSADLSVAGDVSSADFYAMERYLRWANAVKENPELLEIIKIKDLLP